MISKERAIWHFSPSSSPKMTTYDFYEAADVMALNQTAAVCVFFLWLKTFVLVMSSVNPANHPFEDNAMLAKDRAAHDAFSEADKVGRSSVCCWPGPVPTSHSQSTRSSSSSGRPAWPPTRLRTTRWTGWCCSSTWYVRGPAQRCATSAWMRQIVPRAEWLCSAPGRAPCRPTPHWL